MAVFYRYFKGKPEKVIMEKRNIAYLVNLKCDDSNHYKSNCLLYQSFWLMCTSLVNTKRQEHVKT